MVRRGDVVLVKLDPVQGSEQGKTRPAVVIQHDALNKHANTTIIVPITSTIHKKTYAMHVPFQDKTIKVEHIRAIDQERVVKTLGKVPKNTLEQIKQALLHVTDFY